MVCDRSTMTQDAIDNGRLICEIGIAPVKPGGVRDLPDPAEDPRQRDGLTPSEKERPCPPSSATTRIRVTTSTSSSTGVTDEGDAVSCAFTEITGLEIELT